MPLGAWRSVDSGTMRTAEEIVVDDIARSLGRDPVAFRRTTLRGKAVRAVLDRVAEAGHWGRGMPDGHAQGVAVHEEYGSCVACLVEIDAVDPKNPRVTKVVMAADVGTAVNPRGLEAQLMGTAVDGISTVLTAGLHLDRGAVREGSFADFQWARQRHAPLHFEAHIMPSGETPEGPVNSVSPRRPERWPTPTPVRRGPDPAVSRSTSEIPFRPLPTPADPVRDLRPTPFRDPLEVQVPMPLRREC